jgi:hypothetical protein
MKKNILFFTFIIGISSSFYGMSNYFYNNNFDEKNTISITVSCDNQPLDSVKVIILDDKTILGSGWTNNKGLANVIIADVSGLTVNIKAVKKGYETFYLKGGLLSNSTGFQINMNLKTNNPNPTNFLEFQLEKEDIKQPI